MSEIGKEETPLDASRREQRELIVERLWDHGPAWLSVHYLLICLLLFLYIVGDLVSGTNAVISWCGFATDLKASEAKSSAKFLPTLILAFAGGALGGICNELRSFLGRYLVREAFSPRYFWKGVVGPWLGGCLGLFSCALVVGGVAAFGGVESTNPSVLATFGIGALAGYGSQEVTKWLDAQVKRFFAVSQDPVNTPNIIGKSQAQARQILEEVKLELGPISEITVPDPQVGLVISQSPFPNVVVQAGSSIACAIGKKEQ
jgi:hypothetical protein